MLDHAPSRRGLVPLVESPARLLRFDVAPHGIGRQLGFVRCWGPTELLIRGPRTQPGGGGDPGGGGGGDGPPDGGGEPGDGAGNQDAGEEGDADLVGGPSGPVVGGAGSAAGDDAGGLPFTGLALGGMLTLALALLAAGSLAWRPRRR